MYMSSSAFIVLCYDSQPTVCSRIQKKTLISTNSSTHQTKLKKTDFTTAVTVAAKFINNQ